MKREHAGKQVQVAGPVQDPITRKRSSRVGELLSKEDALYVTGRVGKVEKEWLLDSSCNLSLIPVEVYGRIPEGKRPKLEENEVEMKKKSNGSLFPDNERVQLRVKVQKKKFMHPFIVVKLPTRASWEQTF